VISSLTVKWRTDYIPGVADGAARKSSVSIYRLNESMEDGVLLAAMVRFAFDDELTECRVWARMPRRPAHDRQD
jgi:hypothetical protein